MNNQPRFSIRTAARKALVALRTKLNLKPRYTVPEIAALVGLPVVYPEHRPANFDGYLDWHDKPRFIAVNQDLPPYKQALFIARQIAVYNQQRGFGSLILNRPWKWETLAVAPPGIRQKIFKLDEEWRADMIMINHSSGDEYRAYLRNHPEKFFRSLFADNIVAFHLSKLRINAWVYKFRRKFAIA